MSKIESHGDRSCRTTKREAIDKLTSFRHDVIGFLVEQEYLAGYYKPQELGFVLKQFKGDGRVCVCAGTCLDNRPESGMTSITS